MQSFWLCALLKGGIIGRCVIPYTGNAPYGPFWIHVDYANELETAVFIIAHLFGHVDRIPSAAYYLASRSDFS
jgi:hypothetical protein